MKAATLIFVILLPLIITRVDAAPAGPMTVLLLPFDAVTESPEFAWLGRGIQQTVLSELGQLRSLHPVTPVRRGVASVLDVAAARKAGQDAGVRMVVFGSYQVTDQGVRLTGQVIDIETGKLLGGMKATGPIRDLFGLQDAIAEQALSIIAQATPSTAAAPAPATQPTTLTNGNTTIIINTQAPQQQPVRDVDLTYFDRHDSFRDYRQPYYDYDDSYYRHRYSYYPWWWHGPIYFPPDLVPNNPSHIPGPSNIGGTLPIGGSRSRPASPSMGRSIGK